MPGLSSTLRRALIDLTERLPKTGDNPLLARATALLTNENASDNEAMALVERLRRATQDRPVANALEPTRGGRRTSTWDPEVARETRIGASAGGRRVAEGEAAPATRAARRAERSAENKARWAALQDALRGKSPEEQVALRQQYDQESAARTGGAARSAAGNAGTAGTGRNADLRTARSEANRDVNRRLQAKEITKEQADAEYARIREQFSGRREQIRDEAVEGDMGTRAKVGDVQAAREGAYFDTDDPRLRDRETFRKGKLVTEPGGGDPNLVTATSVVRRQIERMVASGEIPAVPPDEAIPGIVRVAMQELRLPDANIDDFDILKFYRAQARRQSPFSRRRPAEPPMGVEGTDDPTEAAVRSLDRMVDRSRSGAPRQDAEAGFVDDIARELGAEDEALPGVELAGDVVEGAQSAAANAPEQLSFREREMLRRGVGRAGTLRGQIGRMTDAGEGAADRNARRARRMAAVDRDPPKPREFFANNLETGEREQVFPNVTPRGRPRPIRPVEGLTPGGAPGNANRFPLNNDPMATEAANAAQDVLDIASQIRDMVSSGDVGQATIADAMERMAARVNRARQMMQAELEQSAGVIGRRMDDAGDLGFVSERFPETMGPQREYPGDGIRTGGDVQTRIGQIESQADEDVDRLVRMLMDRVSRWDPAQRDRFFSSGDLDRQLMLNRDRSRTFRETRSAADRFSGDDVDFMRDDVGFPSRVSRRVPAERGNQSIIAAVLDAIGR